MVQRGWVESTIVLYSLNVFLRNTSPRRSIGKKCLQFFMLFYFDTKPGEGGKSGLPVTIQALSMRLINTPSKAQRLFLFSGYFSSLLSTIFKSSHSGSHRKRILWQIQHLVMTTRNLLILVYKCLTISLDHLNCARSCIPSSQLPRSKHTAKVWENPQNI